MPELVGPEFESELQALMDQESGHSPITWATQLKELHRKSAQTDGANDRLTRFLIRLVKLKAAFEERLYQDPEYFASHRGKKLLALANDGYSANPQEFRNKIFPLFTLVVGESELQRLPMLARAVHEMQFEVWARDFRLSLLNVVERWYKPLLVHFVTVTGWARTGRCDPMPSELGRVMTRARDAWQSDPELLPIVDDHIRIFRNSEGHGHTEVDVTAEKLTFKNIDKGRVTGRFEATKLDLLGLAKGVYEAAELMQLALLSIAYACIKPDIFENAGLHVD